MAIHIEYQYLKATDLNWILAVVNDAAREVVREEAAEAWEKDGSPHLMLGSDAGKRLREDWLRRYLLRYRPALLVEESSTLHSLDLLIGLAQFTQLLRNLQYFGKKTLEKVFDRLKEKSRNKEYANSRRPNIFTVQLKIGECALAAEVRLESFRPVDEFELEIRYEQSEVMSDEGAETSGGFDE